MSTSKQHVETMRIWIERFFLFYILLQPFLDLLSYFGVPISIPIRVLVLGVGCLYLLVYPSKRIRWVSISYIFVLGIFIILHTANNFMAKDPYFFIKEVTYSFKIIYVLAMLLVYFAVFNEMKNKMNWEKIVQRNISINIILISLVMLLAEITSTGNVSYGTPGKEGHSGWFYSPNDQSAVLAMGFGVLILYFLNKKNKNTKIFYAASILLAAWAMMTIGTKVALFSLLTLLGLGILISFLRMLMKKEKAFNLMILTFVLLLVIGITPLTAVGNNMNITYPEFESMTKELKPDTETPNVIEKPEKEKKPHFNDNVDLNYKVFSGRDDFFRNQLEMYKVAPVSQKLLGMGPGGNYEENLKIVEMDFFDWFFGYGIIGFCLFILPIIYFGIMVIKNMFQFKFKQVDRTFLVLGTAIGLGLGIAAVAGHILMNPASGIYFSILLAYFYVLSKGDHLKQSLRL